MIELISSKVKNTIFNFEFLIKEEKFFTVEIIKDESLSKKYDITLNKDFNNIFKLKFDVKEFVEDIKGTYNFNLIVQNDKTNIYNFKIS